MFECGVGALAESCSGTRMGQGKTTLVSVVYNSTCSEMLNGFLGHNRGKQITSHFFLTSHHTSSAIIAWLCPGFTATRNLWHIRGNLLAVQERGIVHKHRKENASTLHLHCPLHLNHELSLHQIPPDELSVQSLA